jgi:hypothetical protein
MRVDVEDLCDVSGMPHDGRVIRCPVMQVMYHPTAGHGGFLLSHSWRRQVLANIKVVVTTGADLAAKAAKVQ